MIRLSPGMLNSASWLINISLHHDIEQNKLLSSQSYIMGVKAPDVIETAILCQWIYIDSSNVLHPYPNAIAYASYSPEMSRQMLGDFILKAKPTWTNLLKRGRKESIPYLDKDSQACFYNSGLMDTPIDKLAADWWIQLESKVFQLNNDKNAETGLDGERLSLGYEEKRVGVQPYWCSIDSNKVGFDILSKVSANSQCELKIEVKASNDYLNNARFHITYNEWLTASASSNYVFHLWLISNHKQLAVIDKIEIEPHIAICVGAGRWETIEIPYNTFEGKFSTLYYE